MKFQKAFLQREGVLFMDLGFLVALQCGAAMCGPSSPDLCPSSSHGSDSSHWAREGQLWKEDGGVQGPQFPPRILGMWRHEVGHTAKVTLAGRCSVWGTGRLPHS